MISCTDLKMIATEVHSISRWPELFGNRNVEVILAYVLACNFENVDRI